MKKIFLKRWISASLSYIKIYDGYNAGTHYIDVRDYKWNFC